MVVKTKNMALMTKLDMIETTDKLLTDLLS